MTKQDIIDTMASKNKALTVVDYDFEQTDTDDLGLPIFKINYVSNPKNFKLIKIIETPRVAVLEDLDYVEPQ